MDICEKCGKELLNISWSSLQRWLNCPTQAKLYSKNRNPTRDIRNYFHGNVTDSAMRKWLKDPIQRPGAMAEMIEAVAIEEEIKVKERDDGVIKWRNKNDRKELLIFCKELVER